MTKAFTSCRLSLSTIGIGRCLTSEEFSPKQSGGGPVSDGPHICWQLLSIYILCIRQVGVFKNGHATDKWCINAWFCSSVLTITLFHCILTERADDIPKWAWRYMTNVIRTCHTLLIGLILMAPASIPGFTWQCRKRRDSKADIWAKRTKGFILRIFFFRNMDNRWTFPRWRMPNSKHPVISRPKSLF